MSELRIKRIYEKESPDDGTRLLVDRLWPRGVSKVRADLSEWDKTIAPTNEARKAFHNNEESFEKFEQDYIEQLNANPDAEAFVKEVADALKKGNVTLLYGSKNQEENNAVVLKQWLEAKLKGVNSHD